MPSKPSYLFLQRSPQSYDQWARKGKDNSFMDLHARNRDLDSSRTDRVSRVFKLQASSFKGNTTTTWLLTWHYPKHLARDYLSLWFNSGTRNSVELRRTLAGVDSVHWHDPGNCTVCKYNDCTGLRGHLTCVEVNLPFFFSVRYYYTLTRRYPRSYCRVECSVRVGTETGSRSMHLCIGLKA